MQPEKQYALLLARTAVILGSRRKMIFTISAVIGGLILIYLMLTIALPEKF